MFGARLRITGLRGRDGPGIEFLEYLAPRTDGRPPASQANDLVALADDGDARADADCRPPKRLLPASTFVRFARRVVALPDDASVSTKACSSRDPDGHACEG